MCLKLACVRAHGLEMAEALAAAAGIAIVKAAVRGLLSELVKDTTSPTRSHNKNLEKLGRMLAQLEPIVDSIPSSAPNSVAAWLENLRTRLEFVKHLLHESHKRGTFSISKKQYSTSKNLAKEIQLLSEILSTAPVVVLPLSIAAFAHVAGLHEQCKEISEQLDVFRNEVQRQDLAQITRQALETPTNSYGNSIDLMTVHKAYSSIKNEADSILSASTEAPEASEQASSSKSRLTYRRLDSETVFGGDEVVEEAKQLLLEETCHKLGLWATGGAGKTHAALRVFDDDTIQAHFSGGCFWLTVGRALSVENLLHNLRFSTTGLLNVRRNTSLEDLSNQLCVELRGKKNMLIVLDDVWEERVLRLVEYVVPSKSGCKIFVTTRNDQVLEKNHVTKLQVPLLSWENSWKLFCWQAFRGASLVPLELEKVAKDVTRECGGLPLALKVIGSVFAGKSDRGFWKLSLEKLRNADVLDQDHESQLYERLKLSVDELPTIHPNLKDCFLYFAAFPEDANVQVYEDLLPLWTGERIVGNNSKYDPKEVACELIGWLVSRSLIELKSETRSSAMGEGFLYCMMHDVLRDLARYILQHKVSVTQRECLYEAGRDLDFPREWAYSEEATGRARLTLSACRLSVMSSNLEALPPKLLDAPKLQVLLLRDNPFKSIPDAFFNNLHNIRVLDLRKTSITSLPKSIGTLKLLVVLNVSSTPLVTLPDSLGNLAGMEQLYLDHCRSLTHLPSSLSSLTRLQTLMMLNTSADMWKDRWNLFRRKCVVQDLLSLVALEQLCISSYAQATLPAGLLTALKKLQKLVLSNFEQLRQFPELGPDDLQHLEFLKLDKWTSLRSLPASFGSLPLLHTLILSSCQSLLSLPALDRFPHLVVLDLTECSELKSLPDTFGRKDAFPALEQLWMYACDKVASFPELEDGAMPCLKILDVGGWGQLDTLPRSLARLKNLRFLSLALCFNLKTMEHDNLSFKSFANLEELVLDYCKVLPHLPGSLALLPNFRLLKLRSCNASIPMELERAISEGRVTLTR
jgi:Leucine-rich repeat (LRR) protein